MATAWTTQESCDVCGSCLCAFRLDGDGETARLCNADDLLEFVDGYLECALWSTTDNSDDSGGDPLDDNYGPDDFDPAAYASAVNDCASFLEDNAADLRGIDMSQAGHDFWLTRNGHGAGFWDRGLGARGDRLSKACKTYGSVDLYVHEGKVHGS